MKFVFFTALMCLLPAVGFSAQMYKLPKPYPQVDTTSIERLKRQCPYIVGEVNVDESRCTQWQQDTLDVNIAIDPCHIPGSDNNSPDCQPINGAIIQTVLQAPTDSTWEDDDSFWFNLPSAQGTSMVYECYRPLDVSDGCNIQGYSWTHTRFISVDSLVVVSFHPEFSDSGFVLTSLATDQLSKTSGTVFQNQHLIKITGKYK